MSMMQHEQIKRIVEAALMIAQEPLNIERLQLIFTEEEKPSSKEIRLALDSLVRDYAGRGVVLKEVASGFRFQVEAELAPWMSRLYQERPPRYSRALLETLAIIAYRQPISRGEIEQIRGVAVSTAMIKTLLEHEWIRAVGFRDVPGKPALYATTKYFLDHFNLKSLEQLPTLAELQATMPLTVQLPLNELTTTNLPEAEIVVESESTDSVV
jgi:segregation and condensation protein B